MQKTAIAIISVICLCLIVLIVRQTATETTIKYFPIDEEADFKRTETDITISEKDVNWSILSKSNQEMYLRQDISLLYENGWFKGVQTKWKQHVAELNMSQKFKSTKSANLQAITFHHGEIHDETNSITSVQEMTADQQFLLVKDQQAELVKNPDTGEDKRFIKDIEDKTYHQLHSAWSLLMTHFQLDPDDYHAVPLIELIKYNQENFPQRSAEETKQIIGQLWEGLYKNYVLALKDEKNKHHSHQIPLILIAKDNTHLLVLFELDEKKQLLKQQLP